MRNNIILGIETSCDETSAAVVVAPRDVRSNIVSTQAELHARYGGVVPEIAARAHLERIDAVIDEALRVAGVALRDIDAIAVTDGPGLVGSLMIGVTAAKTLAMALDKPLVAVDHLEAHATSAAIIAEEPPWPAVSLVVSGGHTSIYLVRDQLTIELLGQTHDDAAGEAFDKVAALLNLGHPGGPLIDRLAQGGNPRAIRFPRAWLDEPHFDFSYSGVKTAVMYHVFGRGQKYGSADHLSVQQLSDLAASFQAAVVEPLVVKTIAAARRAGVSCVTVGGGVAANSALRRDLQRACEAAQLRLLLTPVQYCTDNAAMVAVRGAGLLDCGVVSSLSLEPRSGLRRTAQRRR